MGGADAWVALMPNVSLMPLRLIRFRQKLIPNCPPLAAPVARHARVAAGLDVRGEANRLF
jgi:hypothetical protein